MSFRMEEFTELSSPTPTDKLATQINDKMQELGPDWVPVHLLGIETNDVRFSETPRTPRFLVLFITRNELAGEFGKLLSQFRSNSIAGVPKQQ